MVLRAAGQAPFLAADGKPLIYLSFIVSSACTGLQPCVIFASAASLLTQFTATTKGLTGGPRTDEGPRARNGSKNDNNRPCRLRPSFLPH
jgi:hypothetical protein